jgi:DNA-binding response OmpR family regulator
MSRSILVADDDAAMLTLYKRIFAAKDYVITQASSFSEAAGLIDSNNYDLLITDLMFPDGVGTELIKRFEKKKQGAKSLLVTGSASELDPKLVQEAGCYFEKPFKIHVFMAAVEAALA